MIATLKELLKEAAEQDKAVGSFTCADMEMVIGTIRAAEEENSPVIIQIAEGRLAHTPLDYIGPLMVQAAKDAHVKVCVHLDHGLTRAKVAEALSYGFTSVMYDGSRYEFEENIRRTNEVADLARQKGVSVEAELGSIGGKEATDHDEKAVYTDVHEAVEFVSRTDIDALAVAIGNAHGHYKGIPHLNFERLAMLHDAVDLPLVLHGGSGISDEDFRRCIANGIRKINIATASLDAMTDGAKRYLSMDTEHDFYHLNEAMVEGVYRNVRHCIKVFNNKEKLNEIH